LFLGEDGNVYVNASWITAGVLASKDNGDTFYLDLDKGELRMRATKLSISGKTVEEIAGEAASGAADSLTQQEIFDKLTGGGSNQGLYLSGGKLYLNASYINTGTLDASKMTVSNLNAGSITTGRLKSSGGGTYFDLGTGQIVCDSGDLKVVISGGEVRLYNGTGKQVAMVSADSSNGCLKLYDKDGTERLGITASAQGPLVTLWDASLQREVSSPVCFREVGGVKVIAVGTYGTA
jgi:hypothetical protein